MTYLSQTVFEAALERINFVFDNCDDIVVSMSGGKDSTIVYELAKRIARERGRLPLKVFWLDQEAEWQATEDYMRGVMHDPDVQPYWFQIPFRLTNSLSFRDNWLHCWAPEDRGRWIRAQDPLSIKRNPTRHDRFFELIAKLPGCCDVAQAQHVGVLVGMRTVESRQRRTAITLVKAQYKGITWCRKPVGNTRVFWPIYDWVDRDVWTAIGSEGWAHNRIYDSFYKYGVKQMRVSALIHETAWHSIEALHEVEPQMYNRYLARINGVNCFNHFRDEIMPDKLPPLFASWQEYRDYLLAQLIEPEHQAGFKRRWARKGQTGEDWYKDHVKEIMINDIEGTLNHRHSIDHLFVGRKKGGVYNARIAARKAAAEAAE